MFDVMGRPTQLFRDSTAGGGVGGGARTDDRRAPLLPAEGREDADDSSADSAGTVEVVYSAAEAARAAIVAVAPRLADIGRASKRAAARQRAAGAAERQRGRGRAPTDSSSESDGAAGAGAGRSALTLALTLPAPPRAAAAAAPATRGVATEALGCSDDSDESRSADPLPAGGVRGAASPSCRPRRDGVGVGSGRGAVSRASDKGAVARRALADVGRAPLSQRLRIDALPRVRAGAADSASGGGDRPRGRATGDDEAPHAGSSGRRRHAASSANALLQTAPRPRGESPRPGAAAAAAAAAYGVPRSARWMGPGPEAHGTSSRWGGASHDDHAAGRSRLRAAAPDETSQREPDALDVHPSEPVATASLSVASGDVAVSSDSEAGADVEGARRAWRQGHTAVVCEPSGAARDERDAAPPAAPERGLRRAPHHGAAAPPPWPPSDERTGGGAEAGRDDESRRAAAPAAAAAASVPQGLSAGTQTDPRSPGSPRAPLQGAGHPGMGAPVRDHSPRDAVAAAAAVAAPVTSEERAAAAVARRAQLGARRAVSPEARAGHAERDACRAGEPGAAQAGHAPAPTHGGGGGSGGSAGSGSPRSATAPHDDRPGGAPRRTGESPTRKHEAPTPSSRDRGAHRQAGDNGGSAPRAHRVSEGAAAPLPGDDANPAHGTASTGVAKAARGGGGPFDGGARQRGNDSGVRFADATEAHVEARSPVAAADPQAHVHGGGASSRSDAPVQPQSRCVCSLKAARALSRDQGASESTLTVTRCAGPPRRRASFIERAERRWRHPRDPPGDCPSRGPARAARRLAPRARSQRRRRRWAPHGPRLPHEHMQDPPPPPPRTPAAASRARRPAGRSRCCAGTATSTAPLQCRPSR